MSNRRYFLQKLMGASAGTALWQVFGLGQSPIALSEIDLSSNSENVNYLNIEPRLGYDFLSPIAKGIGGGIGEYFYLVGEAGGNIVRGAGEGIGERLRDIFSNAEGKRKLYEYSQQQDFQRKRELIELTRDSLREFQAKQIDLKLSEIQSNWDLYNWNGFLDRQETKDLLKEQKDCLLILLSPTEISEDAPSSIRNNLKIDLESVEAFLVKYYPAWDKQHLVKFYSDYFKRPIGNINVAQLHKILAPFPTVILNTDITDYYCTVNVHFWGIQNDQPQLYSSQVWKYQQTKKELISKGVDEQEALQIIRQTIVNSNKLLAAYIADLYYLNLDPYYQLCLPKMSNEFNQEGLDKEILNTYLTQLQNIQKMEQQSYEKELKTVAYEFKTKRLWIENACGRPIRFALVYKNFQDEWKDLYWYELTPGKKSYLLDDSVPVILKENTIYYYAETTDGNIFTNWFWDGDDLTRNLGNRTVKMKKREFLSPNENGFYLKLI